MALCLMKKKLPLPFQSSIIAVVLLLQSCNADWQFELKLYSYSNPTSTAFVNSNITVNPKCCDIHIPPSCKGYPCDNVLSFTLSPLTCQSHNASCSYGSFNTGVFSNDDFEFNHTIRAADQNGDGKPTVFPNPLTFRGKEWPMNSVVVLSVYVDDYDETTPNDFIDMILIVIPVSASTANAGFSPTEEFIGYHNISSISISYRMRCEEGYFGATCDDSAVTQFSDPHSTHTIVKVNGFSPTIFPFLHNSVSIQNSTDVSTCTVTAALVSSQGNHGGAHYCVNVSQCSPIDSHSLLTTSTETAVMIGFAIVSALLAFVLLISCVAVCLLHRRNRLNRRARVMASRPLPTVPISVSSNHVELHDCPAYHIEDVTPLITSGKDSNSSN